MMRVALLGGLLVLATACETLPNRREPNSPNDQAAAAGAYQAAVSMCGPAGVIQRPGTDGTNRSDYVCGGGR